ncbi:MAG: ComF family protein [Janthinobacterium lividum]
MWGLDGGSRSEWKDLCRRQTADFALRGKSLGRALTDLVLPPLSYDSAKSVASQGLTSALWSQITFLEDPVCDGCGLPYEHDGGGFGIDRCAACLSHPHRFSRARAACLYDEHSRGLILGLKHGDQQQNAALFARWLSRAAAPMLDDVDAVVPVPLHPLRLLRRRFNQSAEIARPLARTRGLLYLPDSLKRVRLTASQGGKSGRQRRLNVKNAFAVTGRGVQQIKGRHILLVDDVLTTGATANACAEALMAAGARQVDLAVVAGVRGGREMPK